MQTLAEQSEKIGEVKSASTRQLQLEESVLARIQVDCMQGPYTGKKKVQDVASSTRNHYYAVVRIEFKRELVQFPVFPADGVDQAILNQP
jgi:hypothetical protein